MTELLKLVSIYIQATHKLETLQLLYKNFPVKIFIYILYAPIILYKFTYLLMEELKSNRNWPLV